MKPERWGSPLVQEKYQEVKACEKRHPYRIIIIIIREAELITRTRQIKTAYLKAKIKELENNSKIKNIRDLYRGTNGFKKGYQPRTNIVKVAKGDLVADFHSILARRRNYLSKLLNVHGVNDIRNDIRKYILWKTFRCVFTRNY